MKPQHQRTATAVPFSIGDPTTKPLAALCRYRSGDGNRADVRVLQEGLPSACGVTVVGDTAFVLLLNRGAAVPVPYRRR